ncbi:MULTISPECIES: RNA 2',3'-cyclic phosphodiesterase [Exiguobacterium]|uniref:RNA 2',3'-cyclic phosphodiesterase n=1 Tax=Exiguobacterium TaxID=33986 RepID=UPI001BEB95D5|nr:MULTISPECIES: RNA 2',3'-cyclic phosphodiesterase [Exiguobacterium]MCT4783922.1 RNA 2',3'-cyclic phosphodiesterase [Exiguobacterium himgiriensis]
MTTHYFIALPMEADEFARIQREVIPYYSYRRIYRPDEFHLTLQYLGALDEDQVETVKEITKHVADETRPFTLTFEQIDFFGRPDRPRVLTIVPEASPALTTFVSALRTQLHEEIPGLDRKSFVPHVTLAKKWDSGHVIPHLAPTFQITEAIDVAVLYRINPSHTPAYEAVDVFPLTRSEEDTWRSRLKFLT